MDINKAIIEVLPEKEGFEFSEDNPCYSKSMLLLSLMFAYLAVLLAV